MTDDTPRPGAATDNPASRKGPAEQLADIAVAVTPAIDGLATVVRDFGGTMCVVVEVDGHLFTRRSLRSRFAVTLRDPDDGVAVERELAPAGATEAPPFDLASSYRFDLPGGYSVEKRPGWPWYIHLHGEPLRLTDAEAVYIDGDGEVVRAFFTAIGVEVQS